MIIREIIDADYDGLMRLYTQFKGEKMPDKSAAKAVWEHILSDPNHHVIVAEENGTLVSTCVCIIVPNLTHYQEPYALIENVVTDAAYRNKGCATACLQYAKTLAVNAGCYKMMLLTGSKAPETLRFYENAGYNCHDKTGFIQWLE